MKHITYIFIALLMGMTWACSSNDAYDDMPQEIQNFISQYYPNSQLESFTSSDSGYVAILKNGPTMTFGLNCKWTQINGNGSVLPQVLLFNDLPPDLYNYLQETEQTNSVFKLTRTSTTYTVELLQYTISYDISSGKITGSDAQQS
ncbi:MAG: PepSY-like domain-containing protein [Bacteroidales bacterium]|nr:PepSY-like domain-containing protein [Bacteroidales bacterium]